MTIEEINELYQATIDKRERAVLSLAYGCGMRRSEIAALNVNDVLFNKGMILVRDGKNHRSRTIPVSDNVMKELKDYLLYERGKYRRNNFSEQAFMLNYLGERLSGGHLNNLIKYIVKRTTIKKEISLHCLRHSIATHLLDKEADIVFVKNFLGHQEIDTSHIYSKRRKQRLNILNQIHE